jgi:hypothetical protein
MSRRLASLVLATALWFAATGTAHACGVWSLRDKGQGWLVVFRSIAVEVVHHPEEKRPRRIVSISAARKPSKEQDWRLMRFDLGERQWRLGDGRAFSFKGGAIHLDGKQVGTFSNTDIEIGRRHFLQYATCRVANRFRSPHPASSTRSPARFATSDVANLGSAVRVGEEERTEVAEVRRREPAAEA